MSANALALPTTVADIVDEYTAKVAGVADAIAEAEAAVDRMKAASIVQGVYVENVVDTLYLRADAIRANLRKSGWKAVYNRLNIAELASANDKRLFERTLADPPELTLDNAKATFGDYLIRPRFHKLRALAEVFVQLDPAYKSHSKVKIGVAGLPKRVILGNVGSYSSYGYDRLRDVLNALAAVQGEVPVSYDELRRVGDLCRLEHLAGEVIFDGRNITSDIKLSGTEQAPPNRGVTLRKFKNGNGHVIFDEHTLLEINRALAEFYGEVLPDADDDNAPPRASTDLCADLQFYPTPAAVIKTVLDAVGIYKIDDRHEPRWHRVLEPSCGDGRVLDELAARGCASLGIEVHAQRARQARAKGHAVVTGNFLEQPAAPEFEFVVMNPPFSGKHYRKHLAHAFKFLKPGGLLACILPASAWYDHGGLDGEWHDLPVASFAESGTNIPTGYLIVKGERR